MASAEGVKNNLQSLITKVNQKTGRSFTNISDVVSALITGLVINGALKQYGVLAGATVYSGDFVEIVKRWGSGNIRTASTTALQVVTLSDSSVVAVYINSSNKVEAVALTITDNAVTIGTPVTISDSASTTHISAVAMSPALVLVAYNTGSSKEGRVVVMSVNGSTIQMGTSLQFYSGPVYAISSAKLDLVRGIISYSAGYNSEARPGYARVVNVTGTSITLGTDTIYSDNCTDHCLVPLSAYKVLAVYCNPAQTSDVAGKAIVLTVNGTTVTKGTLYIFRNNFIGDITAAALSDTKVVVAYYDKGNSSAPVAELLTISGDRVTEGTQLKLETGVVASKPTLTNLDGSRTLMTWNTATATKAAVLSGNSSTLTRGTVVTLASGATSGPVDVTLTSENTAVVAYVSGSATKYCSLDITASAITVTTGAGGRKVKRATTNNAIAGVAATGGTGGATIDVYRPSASD